MRLVDQQSWRRTRGKNESITMLTGYTSHRMVQWSSENHYVIKNHTFELSVSEECLNLRFVRFEEEIMVYIDPDVLLGELPTPKYSLLVAGANYSVHRICLRNNTVPKNFPTENRDVCYSDLCNNGVIGRKRKNLMNPLSK
ncbi:hypothetical protein Smp_161340 [Schistosoma mansoni]|uniref:hypothetical protein n=1 Tax=Schistosoma mansoni TaxID=6183 RepID=UPI0001A61B49|nr:hypothetical protein Smp_161340 [Schistosoma mansoni]|eukprot:XP_018649160.1 hypothetical protein Smp_161340 [Schistosoma mansoni]